MVRPLRRPVLLLAGTAALLGALSTSAAATTTERFHLTLNAYGHEGECVNREAQSDYGQCTATGHDHANASMFSGADRAFRWEAGRRLGLHYCQPTPATQALGYTKKLLVFGSHGSVLCGWTAPNFGSASLILARGDNTISVGHHNVHPYTEDNPAKTGHSDGPLSIHLVHHGSIRDCSTCQAGYALTLSGYLRWEE